MFQRCPFSNDQLNALAPTLVARAATTTATSKSGALNLLPLPTFKSAAGSGSGGGGGGSKNLEISDVNTISADMFNVTGNDTNAIRPTGLNLKNILTVPDLNRVYSIEDAQCYFDTITDQIEIQNRKDILAKQNAPVRTTKKTATAAKAAAAAAAAAPPPPQTSVAASFSRPDMSQPQTSWYERSVIKPTAETTAADSSLESVSHGNGAVGNATPRSTQLQKEIDNAAYALVKGTGLEGRELYRCGFEDCTGTGSDPICFNVHLLKHTNADNQDKGFKCYHCSLYSKNIIGLKYHIKVHGIHRYFCYFCDHTGPIMNYTLKHMSDTHKKSHVVTFPLNTRKTDQNKDMFVICPRGLRQDELNRFGLKLLDRYKDKISTKKKFYSPDEIDLLPMKSILNDFIKCSVCDYSTKVRTNMQRHLSMHINEKSVTVVGKVDPVNPVPCLDSGEKHFDKMKNLACSSNGTVGVTTVSVISTGITPWSFISEERRFVCNAKGCHYLTINESMLRGHLAALHVDEVGYKCPHCNIVIHKSTVSMNVEKIILHMRMHDSKIFKCPKCTFYHHHRNAITKHITELHAGCTEAAVLLVRTVTADQGVDGGDSVTTTSTVINSNETVSGAGSSQWTAASSATTTTTSSASFSNSIDTTGGGGNESTINGAAAANNAKSQKSFKWKCMLCNEKFNVRNEIAAHAQQWHSITNQFECDVCNSVQSNKRQQIVEHLISKHPNDEKRVKYFYMKVECNENDSTTPIWRRDDPNKVKHIRGILFEDDEESGTAAEKKRAKRKRTLTMDSSPLATGGIVVNKEFEHDMLPMIDANDIINAARPPKDRRLTDLTPIPATIASTSSSMVENNLDVANAKLNSNGCILFKCVHCTEMVESVAQLFAHWHAIHKRGRPAVPFQFGIRCIIRCALHIQDPIGAELADCVNCKPSKSDYLTQEMVDHLLSTDYVGSHLCEHCHSGFSTHTEYKMHHRAEHIGLEERYKFAQNQIEYKCPSCDLIGNDEMQMVRHVRSHHIKYQCFYCEKEYAQPKLVRVHHTKIHRVYDRKVRIVSSQQYRDIYERISIIFRNGLVLSMLEASKTTYGRLDNVLAFADKLNTDEMAILAAGNASPLRGVSTLAAAATTTNNNDSDSSTSMQSPAKKRRLSTTGNLVDRIKSELPEKHNSSPGQTESVVKNPKVDLRQIFTDMNIGGSNIRVSCDRLAKFMDINPVVCMNNLTAEYIERKCK